MNSLQHETIGSNAAPVVVLFGGDRDRRNEVINLLKRLGDITVYGTLSEAEGLATLEELGTQVSLVLIGGRYTPEQRLRIQAWLAEHLPQAKLTQPGYDYAYSNEAILADVKSKLFP